MALTGHGQSIFIGEERQVPRKYTQPELTKNANGTISYKPSVPTDFETVYTGALLSPGVGAVSLNAKTLVRVYEVHLKGGTTIKVRENETFRAGGTTYRMLGFRDDKLLIRNESTGAEMQLGKSATDSDAKPAAKKRK